MTLYVHERKNQRHTTDTCTSMLEKGCHSPNSPNGRLKQSMLQKGCHSPNTPNGRLKQHSVN